jgi:hypothetical protein
MGYRTMGLYASGKTAFIYCRFMPVDCACLCAHARSLWIYLRANSLLGSRNQGNSAVTGVTYVCDGGTTETYWRLFVWLGKTCEMLFSSLFAR